MSNEPQNPYQQPYNPFGIDKAKHEVWQQGADAMKAYYEARPAPDEEQVREAVASAEHEQWIRWAKSITIELKILTANHPKDCVCKTCLRIPRWEKLFIPYAELTEESKDQDRKEADIVLSLVGSRQEGRQEVVEWAKVIIKPFLVGFAMRIEQGLNPEYGKSAENLAGLLREGFRSAPLNEEQVRQEGRQEVVNFIGGFDKPFPNQREWKAQLKEWGIKEGK